MSEFIESPLFRIGGSKNAVVFRGQLMRRCTAARIKQFEEPLRRHAGEGMTMTQIARRLGYCVISVRKWAKLLGVEITGNRNRPTLHDTAGWYDVVAAGIKAGLTQEEIGAKLGVHSMQIHRYCRRKGISWRRAKHFQTV